MEESVCLPFYTALCLLGLLICDNEDNRPLTFAVGLPVLTTHCPGCLVNVSAKVSANLVSQALLGTMDIKVPDHEGLKTWLGKQARLRESPERATE